MNKLVIILFVFVSSFSFAQNPAEIQLKAQHFSDKFQAATGATSTQAIEATSQLTDYFNARANGQVVNTALQNQVNAIFAAIGTHTRLPQDAPSFQLYSDGSLTSSDPVYNRVMGTTPYNISCITQGDLSALGTSVYYKLIPFTVTSAGNFDIEVMSFTQSDTYMSLYCAFNPALPTNNLITSNDDGTSLLSKFSSIFLPPGVYYLVLTTFENGKTGDYSIQFSSNNGVLYLGTTPPVPVSVWWISGIFILLAGAIVVKRFIL